jgi:hypothetical protein
MVHFLTLTNTVPTKKLKEGKQQHKTTTTTSVCSSHPNHPWIYPSLCAIDYYCHLTTILLVTLCAQSQYTDLVFKRLWFEFAIHPFSALRARARQKKLSLHSYNGVSNIFHERNRVPMKAYTSATLLQDRAFEIGTKRPSGS